MTPGQRLHLARELRGLTQTDLAAACGLDQPTVSRLEADRALLREPELALLAAALEFPETFFFDGPQPAAAIFSVPEFTQDSLRFRARAGALVRDLRQAKRWGQLLAEQADRLARSLRSIPNRLPRMVGADPAIGAHALREALGLSPLTPVPYLVVAVERLGLRVLGVPFPAGRQDAFSAWIEDRPVLALLSGAPGDRLRYSVAHELGHLVLHDTSTDHAVAEQEADQFAAELLTPIDAMRIHLPGRPTLAPLLAMKNEWKVSLRVLVRRAREAGLLDEVRYAGLFRQLSARGWTKTEPGLVSVEKPRAFRKMAELTYGEAVDLAQFSADARWNVPLVEQVLAQHATRDELPLLPASKIGDSVPSNVRLLRRHPG